MRNLLIALLTAKAPVLFSDELKSSKCRIAEKKMAGRRRNGTWKN